MKNRLIPCVLACLMIFLDLVMNCIHKYKRIHSFKRSVLPCSNIRHNLLAYLADKLGRDFYIIKIFDLFCNVTLTHSAGVERKNFLFHTVCITIVFADWIYTKKVDKYDKIEDKQRRNKNDRKEKQ